MNNVGSLPWLARHEGRLAWRDLIYLMTAGQRWRLWKVGVFFLVLIVIFHGLAYGMVRPYADASVASGTPVLATITGSLMLSFCLMVSQALEQVTRLFYARGDIDLLKSSPISLRRVFTLRIVSIALSTIVMALVVVAPFLNVLIFLGGGRWAAGFGVAVAIGLAAAGLSVAMTAALFDTLGPRRTRLASQIVSAVVGSAFVIGVQAAAILSFGTISRQTFFTTGILADLAPSPTSLFWIPARAVLGDGPALLALLVLGIILLALPLLLFAHRMGDYVIATARSSRERRGVAHAFRAASPRQLLWRKEWVLLLRDPWLASQSLMQLLYLLPPALLLWRSYGDSAGSLVVLAPVLTMAAGQLAGGLAWLAVSGEDAPDLIASAPISAMQALTAKTEAVLIAVFAVFAPFVLALLGLSLAIGCIVAGGICLAALSSTLIQIWFRSQAKRRYFRRRQTSSRLATFAEAFSSVSWAMAAAAAAGQSWLAIGPAILAGLILLGAWLLRPR
jgi:ABC-2 type transport system permease protein